MLNRRVATRREGVFAASRACVALRRAGLGALLVFLVAAAARGNTPTPPPATPTPSASPAASPAATLDEVRRLVADGQPAEALARFAALPEATRTTPAGLALRARAAWGAGREEEARAAAEAALAQRERLPEAQLVLAALELRKGRRLLPLAAADPESRAAALVALRRARDLAGGVTGGALAPTGAYYSGLAFYLLYHLERDDEAFRLARERFAMADVAAAPASVRCGTLWHLGLLAEWRGEAATARGCWARLRQLAPADSPLAAEAAARLRRLAGAAEAPAASPKASGKAKP